jgi:hypothetical protein
MLDRASPQPVPAGAVSDEKYVQGTWRCAKCKFELVQRTLNVCDGSITGRDTPGDKCPNCNVPLWRVTWKEQACEAMKRLETAWMRVSELEAAASHPAQAVSVPDGWQLVPKEPTDEMFDAGRSAVMARDCSSKNWSPRQHFEASGVRTAGIPDKALDGYHSIIPKGQGACLVYYAMLAAAPSPP